MPDAGNPGDLDSVLHSQQVNPASTAANRLLLLLVEGSNDAEFLVRLSRVLYEARASAINLADLVASRRIVIVPFGGGIAADWWNRFAPLGCPEFHLYDREVEPQTSQRRELACRVNSRPFCCAVLSACLLVCGR